jgi:hypothetical protein
VDLAGISPSLASSALRIAITAIDACLCWILIVTRTNRVLGQMPPTSAENKLKLKTITPTRTRPSPSHFRTFLASAQATTKTRQTRMKRIFCVLKDGGVLVVDIRENQTTAHLKNSIKRLAPRTFESYDAHRLTLYRAWAGDKWLNTDTTDLEQQKQEILSQDSNIMQADVQLGSAEFAFTDGETHHIGDINVLVRLPRDIGAWSAYLSVRFCLCCCPH